MIAVAERRAFCRGQAVPTLLAALLGPVPLAAQEPAVPTHRLTHVATIPGAGHDDAYFLTHVMSVIADEGTLVVHDHNPEPSLMAFDAGGRFLHRIGREGRGPGEYLVIRALGFLGDTLWITDPRQRRVTWYREGELVRVETWGEPDLVASPVAFLEGGTVVAYETAGTDRFRPLVRQREGTVVAELPVLRTESTNVRRNVSFRDQPLNMVNPFAATALTARGPDGSGIAWVERLRPMADTTSSYRVVRWRHGALTTRQVEYQPAPLPNWERERWDEVVEAYVTQLGARAGYSRRDLTRAFEDAFPVPDHALPVYQAELDDEGHVWLATHSDAEAMTWVRLGPSLEPELAVRVPADERVVEINERRVVTVWKDALDVPQVRVYGILAR